MSSSLTKMATKSVPEHTFSNYTSWYLRGRRTNTLNVEPHILYFFVMGNLFPVIIVDFHYIIIRLIILAQTRPETLYAKNKEIYGKIIPAQTRHFIGEK